MKPINQANQNQLSFFTAVIISINIIIGAGIYFGPQSMTQKAGSFSFLGWILAAVLFFPVIWAVAQAARMFPGNGGFYRYASSGLGQTAGFITLWLYLLGNLAVSATLVRVLAELITSKTGLLIPWATPLVYSLVIIIFYCLLNLVSIKNIGRIQSIATILKLLPLFCVIILFGFYMGTPVTYAPQNLLNLGATLPMAIFGYWGFESCCSLGKYLKGGSTKAFGIILTAFFVTAVLYTLFNFGIIQIMGVQNLITYGVSAFPLYLTSQSPSIIATILSWVLVITLILNYFNTIYGLALINSDNIVFLAQEKLVLFSEKLTKTNNAGRPKIAILIEGLAVLALASCIPNQLILVAISNLGLVLSVILTLISVLKVQALQKASYAALIMSLAGLGSCIILFYYSWLEIGNVLYTVPLLFIFCFGLLMFKICKKQTRQQ